MLSIVIPTYTISEELRRMTWECIRSYRKYADELIICEDGGRYDEVFKQVADSYIYNARNVGFTGNVNRGWRYAIGDYVAIVSSDTFLVSGDFRDLCVEDKVTSPDIDNQRIDGLAGCCFVAHKDCPKYLIETMKTYYSDEEYKDRTKDCFVKVNNVVIHHHGAQTVKEAGVEGNMDDDRRAYDLLK